MQIDFNIITFYSIGKSLDNKLMILISVQDV